MRKLGFLTLLMAAFACGMGCSKQTQDKAAEAASATGEAVKSAAKDTAENMQKAGEELEEGVDMHVAPEEAGEQ